MYIVLLFLRVLRLSYLARVLVVDKHAKIGIEYLFDDELEELL